MRAKEEQAEAFALTMVVETGVMHHLIERGPDGVFLVNGVKVFNCNILSDLVRYMRNPAYVCVCVGECVWVYVCMCVGVCV